MKNTNKYERDKTKRCLLGEKLNTVHKSQELVSSLHHLSFILKWSIESIILFQVQNILNSST